MNEVTIFATDDTARKFVLFQKYFVPFNIMVEHQVFEQVNCAITLHFDINGVLQDIKRSDSLYSRKFA